MSLLDLAVTLLVAVFAVLGFARGLVRGALDLLLFAAACSLAVRFYRAFARALVDGGLDRALAPVVAFAAILLGVMVVGAVALRIALAPARAFPWPPPLPFLNRLLGLGPGIVKGILAAGVVLAPLSALREEYGLSRFFATSQLAPVLAATATRIMDRATDGFWLDPGDAPAPPDPLPGLRELPFVGGDQAPAVAPSVRAASAGPAQASPPG